MQAYHATHLSEARAYRQSQKAERGEEIRALQRQSYLRNAVNIRRRKKIYKALHQARYTALQRKREAVRLQAIPAWADFELIQSFYDRAHELTQTTGVPHQVDHIVPLQSGVVCGLHVQNNLQILTAAENAKKKNRFDHRADELSRIAYNEAIGRQP